ncbi:MAG: hypothetical protein J0I57_07435 [Hyphomicrobium sp.]|jgi:hypothetical protein|nr:hypothetical protein [Hyphomicrobium sp.]OJU22482.1 MAG: hypothetical protein BGN89_00950 [Alphaproteobacteria bacterium 64-6]
MTAKRDDLTISEEERDLLLNVASLRGLPPAEVHAFMHAHPNWCSEARRIIKRYLASTDAELILLGAIALAELESIDADVRAPLDG